MINGGDLIFCFFTRSNGNCKKQEVRMVRGEQRLIRFLSDGWDLVKGLSNVRFGLKKVFNCLVILLSVFADSIGDYRRYYIFKGRLFLEKMSAMVIADEVNFTQSLQGD